MPSAAPNYDAHQEAFHRAFKDDLYRLLDSLPFQEPARVLDVPCGNGFYTARLAGRLRHGDRLIAVDTCEAYLERVRTRLAGVPVRGTVEVRRADAYHLPDPPRTFDLVWCAQSLISLDPAAAVRELFRVVKPDGTVAILEGDEFHHLVLPWPVGLEAAIPAAIHAASARKYGDPGKLAPARRLRRVLKECGFRSVRRVTVSIDRAAPFDPATAAFLGHHVAYLREFAYPFLAAPLRQLFDRLTDPGNLESLFRRPDADLVCLNAVYLARPEARRRVAALPRS